MKTDDVPAVPPPSSGSAGFGQTRTLTMDDVILALKSIGLGGKLVNAALVEMGYKLIPFPTQNVPRQQSLAGRAGGSHGVGAKALGLLFWKQAPCLSGGT